MGSEEVLFSNMKVKHSQRIGDIRNATTFLMITDSSLEVNSSGSNVVFNAKIIWPPYPGWPDRDDVLATYYHTEPDPYPYSKVNNPHMDKTNGVFADGHYQKLVIMTQSLI